MPEQAQENASGTAEEIIEILEKDGVRIVDGTRKTIRSLVGRGDIKEVEEYAQRLRDAYAARRETRFELTPKQVWAMSQAERMRNETHAEAQKARAVFEKAAQRAQVAAKDYEDLAHEIAGGRDDLMAQEWGYVIDGENVVLVFKPKPEDGGDDAE